MPYRKSSPMAAWVGSPNYTPNRAGHDMNVDPRYIVLHTMVACESGARARFSNPNEQASSTYGVTLDGRVVQYVDERDAPWTNGTMYNNPGANLDSITIEHEDCGDYNGPRTPELYKTSALLVRDIANFYGIPLDRTHVGSPHELGHRECAGTPTACPDSLDMDRIVKMASGEIPLDSGETTVTIEDTVTPSAPVQGSIFQNAQWYNWENLSALQTTDETNSTGSTVFWTEAKKVNGVWYDRIAKDNKVPGDWALKDDDVDDGGHDPTFFRPAPIPIPEPIPTPPPVPEPIPSPINDAVKDLEDRVLKLEDVLNKIKVALS